MWLIYRKRINRTLSLLVGMNCRLAFQLVNNKKEENALIKESHIRKPINKRKDQDNNSKVA